MSKVVLIPPNNDEELVNEDSVLFIENILGSEFENYIGNLPSINIPFEIKVGTQFSSMDIAIHFIEQYAFQKHFAIYKQLPQNPHI